MYRQAFFILLLAFSGHAEPLFNGYDLTGFYTWLVDTCDPDPRRVFSVTNGMIRISGDGLGYLATEREYDSYHLIAEWQWGARNYRWGDRIGRARDSGIFLHSIGPDGNSYDGKGAFRAAIECQLFQGATGDILLIRGTNEAGALIVPRVTARVGSMRDADHWPFWQQDGQPETLTRWGRLNWFGKSRTWRDELDFHSVGDIEKPGWNRVECICRDGRLTVILNGIVVNEAFDVYPRRGKILLQCEGSEIFFRKLELLK